MLDVAPRTISSREIIQVALRLSTSAKSISAGSYRGRKEMSNLSASDNCCRGEAQPLPPGFANYVYWLKGFALLGTQRLNHVYTRRAGRGKSRSCHRGNQQNQR
jgi:hypothetical protein